MDRDEAVSFFQDEAMVDSHSEDQRVLSFCTIYWGYAPPFCVIPDEGFYLSHIGIHGPKALDALKEYLHGDTMFMMTRCCYNNIREKNESAVTVVRIDVYECGCRENNIGIDCISKILKSRQFGMKKKREVLSIFLATNEEMNFFSIEEEYPIIEASEGILELSVTSGALASFGKFKGGKGAEIVWRSPRVDGKKSISGVSGTKKSEGLLTDARKRAEAGMAGKDTYKIADGQRSKGKAVQADARKTAAKEATEMVRKGKRFRNAEKVPDGNEHSGKKAAKSSKQKSN